MIGRISRKKIRSVFQMTYKQALEKGTKLLEAERIIDAKIDAWYINT